MSSDQRMTTAPQAQAPARTSTGDPRIATVKQLFESAAPRMADVLPQHLTIERMIKVSLACITRTPKLLECSPASLLQCVMQCAEMGLEPGGVLGEAYLVPYKTTCTVIPGYRGLVTLARRSGYVRDIEAVVVREGDKWRYKRGLTLVLDHTPNIDGDQGREVRAVYMIAHLKGATRPHVEVMSRSDVDRIRDRSQAYKFGSSPWHTDYAEMAKKTVVRRGIKMLPMSVELAKAIELDDEDYIEAEATEVTRSEPPETGKSFGKRLKARAAADAPVINFDDALAAASEQARAAPEPAAAPTATSSPTTSSSSAGAELAKGLEPALAKPAQQGMTFQEREDARAAERQRAADAREAEEAERHFKAKAEADALKLAQAQAAAQKPKARVSDPDPVEREVGADDEEPTGNA